MNIEGKIKVIFDTQTFDSGFQKRDFVLNTFQDQYPQDIKFEIYNEKCEVLENFAVEDEVKVEFNIRGKEYNGKYFVNLQAWRLEKAEQGAGDNMPPLSDLPAQGDNLVPDNGGTEEDDLPF
ncbi:MAG: DUF3127 domain-containing protein [Flavobacteriales bacterium]|nr:DUF3127 domain-containing protein [Flavobacteriales bacterium]